VFLKSNVESSAAGPAQEQKMRPEPHYFEDETGAASLFISGAT
jgi:hypothetical protein